jgi:hypothetical protein
MAVPSFPVTNDVGEPEARLAIKLLHGLGKGRVEPGQARVDLAARRCSRGDGAQLRAARETRLQLGRHVACIAEILDLPERRGSFGIRGERSGRGPGGDHGGSAVLGDLQGRQDVVGDIVETGSESWRFKHRSWSDPIIE